MDQFHFIISQFPTFSSPAGWLPSSVNGESAWIQRFSCPWGWPWPSQGGLFKGGLNILGLANKNLHFIQSNPIILALQQRNWISSNLIQFRLAASLSSTSGVPLLCHEPNIIDFSNVLLCVFTYFLINTWIVADIWYTWYLWYCTSIFRSISFWYIHTWY